MSITCDCGRRMSCVDTRTAGKGTRRRYSCECGIRLTTKEAIVAIDGGQPIESEDYLRGVADGSERMLLAIRAFAAATKGK
jgi:hypothetical protein